MSHSRKANHLRLIEGGAASCAGTSVRDLRHIAETAKRAYQIAIEAKAGPKTLQRAKLTFCRAFANLLVATDQAHLILGRT